MNRKTFAALALALSLPVLGAPALVSAQASSAPSTVQAGTYAVETHHTLAEFTVNHFGFNDFFGVIPGATGSLTINPANLAVTKLDVSLPVSGISTTNATLDGELTSADWFDAAKYPTIHFVAHKVTKTGERTARIEGDVTMHGVTRPLTLDATFGGSGVNPMSKAFTIGFSATGTLKRSEFGVSKYVPFVSDEVRIKISAAFEKQA